MIQHIFEIVRIALIVYFVYGIMGAVIIGSLEHWHPTEALDGHPGMVLFLIHIWPVVVFIILIMTVYCLFKGE